jgi:cytoskeletal protein RodZ
VADSSTEPFGKVLADARLARRMTLQQVSTATKIPVSKLQALERDEIEALPGGIFTRGFVRSYAEVVGLDPQATVADFQARFPQESSVASLHATIEGRANEEFVKRQRTAKGLIWVALLSLPLVVWLAWGVLPAGQPPTEEEAVADEIRPGAVEEPESPVAAAATEMPAAESEAPPDAPPLVAADAPELTMELSATRDCWVQASADGDTVVSRILRPGDEAVVVAREAIDLRVGDAGAFVFTVNQRTGRSLGAAGEVVNVQVTPSNFLSFVTE